MHQAVSFSYSDIDKRVHAFEIRNRVFVAEQEVREEEEYDEFEPTSIHYLVYINEKPVGTARWRITESGIKLERFAVLKEYRNSGAGRTVLLKVLEDVKPLGKKIYLNAQITAMKFYEREGFVAEGEMFMECDIQHYRMTLGNN